MTTHTTIPPNDPFQGGSNPGCYSEARQIHAFLLRCEGLTLKAIGNRLGVSKEQARVLSVRARRKFIKFELELWR